MALILVVDDERSMREFLEIFLARKGHEVQVAQDGREATRILEDSEFDLVITDLKMPGIGGMEVLDSTHRRWPDTEVIVMTAFSTTETAVEAMKKGAHDYIAKPFKINEVEVVIDKALQKRTLVRSNQRLRQEVHRRFSFESLVGASPRMKEVYDTIRQIADTRTNVLLLGESGTGKEMVARALHYNSSRSGGPFVVINCGAIPDTLMESELFGHVKGAFTGAVVEKKGLFEVADSGTLFLDEIGELSLHLQVKLLRALQERKIKRVGGMKETDIDVRLVAATNKDLEEEVRKGTFRDDLYFRINVIQVNLPPLRERTGDIPLLAAFFLERYNEELGKRIRGLTQETLDLLGRYDYPGNVRELENVIQRAVAFEQSDWVTPSSLPPRVRGSEATPPPHNQAPSIPERDFSLDSYVEDLERTYLVSALSQTGGNVTDAAKKLGISFRSMRYKMSKYGIRKEGF
ncbi:MAG: sigma-54-dependent Fis family transcriptional regulator [Deltaproteobacteria bacterium]|nr:sigma-54-dependent Fis family transcriptional regulator [Deltaproteobacteria bacterium]